MQSTVDRTKKLIIKSACYRKVRLPIPQSREGLAVFLNSSVVLFYNLEVKNRASDIRRGSNRLKWNAILDWEEIKNLEIFLHASSSPHTVQPTPWIPLTKRFIKLMHSIAACLRLGTLVILSWLQCNSGNYIWQRTREEMCCGEERYTSNCSRRKFLEDWTIS